MKIDSIAHAGSMMKPEQSVGESVAEEREESQLSLSVDDPSQDENKVGAEEVLSKIKALTEDGMYSVRFEMGDDTNDLIIRLEDAESGELIRQVPPEEVLDTSARLDELRGVLINTVG